MHGDWRKLGTGPELAIDADQEMSPSQAPSDGLTGVYEDIPAIAAILDERGIMLALSKECAARFGANASRLVGRSILSLCHKDDRPLVAAALQTALRDRTRIANCEFRVWRGAKPAAELRTSVRATNSGSGPTLLVAVASDITDRTMLENELRTRLSEIDGIAGELLVAQERERRRIAADMHDTVGHNLAMAKFHIDSLRTIELDAGARAAVKVTREMIQEAIDALRTLTFKMNLSPLNDKGLDAAVEELGQSLSAGTSLQFSLSSRPRKRRLSQNARIELFRMIRELLVNAVKHSKANQVRVSIGANAEDLHIAVADDGIGFDQESLAQTSGTGIANIRRKLNLIDGALSVEARRGGGTQIRIRVPYNQVGEIA